MGTFYQLHLTTAYSGRRYVPSAVCWAVTVAEPHFPVFPEFRAASYAQRYELFCRKLVRERLYDSACFLLSDRVGGLQGGYREPSRDLCFSNFVTSLTGHAATWARTARGR